MVIAHHLVWTNYGTWLPNDPRGSGSRTVAAPPLAELGELHYGRRKKQPTGHILDDFYQRAEPRLLFDVIRFDSNQTKLIAEALANAIQEFRYTCYACAIMPDHVHMVIRKHKHRAEDMIDNLQAASRLWFSKTSSIGPEHPLWTRGGWKRFVSTPDAVRAVVKYVECNPVKAGLPPQRWPFVTAYDNWPHHKSTRNRPR